MDKSLVVRVIAQQLNVSENGINEKTRFSDLGADSLDLFQVISALEEEFDMEFDNDNAEKIKTVGDAMDYIKTALE